MQVFLKEELNKEAYLDLSKPYTHKQSNTTKKDNIPLPPPMQVFLTIFERP
jgi:hypothetical protein